MGMPICCLDPAHFRPPARDGGEAFANVCLPLVALRTFSEIDSRTQRFSTKRFGGGVASAGWE